MNENLNPFDADNLITGGGLWDGKVVTIMAAKTCLDPMARRDGTPVLNEQTGQQAIRHVLQITGIADDGEKERVEKYSAGSLVPTADGEGFCKPDGSPGLFHASSEMGKFTAGLKGSGFDTSLLFKDGKTRVSSLVGARFLMKGEALKDKTGKVKINDKGYEQQKFYPVEFKGWTGKGPAASASNVDYAPKAAEVVLAILAESNGKVTRADLIRKISQKLAGDPDVNKVLALISKDDFHKDKPWTRDGTGYSL